VSGKRVHFLAVDENLHGCHRRQVRRQRVHDRIDGEQLVQRAARMGAGNVAGEIDERFASVPESTDRLSRADRGKLECAALGDVHVHLYNLRDAHFFPSTPLVLGTGALSRQKVRLETVTVEPGSVLVMFTDGLKSRTSLKGQLDILRQPPIAIAQHLIENDSRPDDDALVMVARFRNHSEA